MSIGALTGTSGAELTDRAQTNRLAELSSDEFIKIMITELTNQDPLEPTDSSAVLEQLSSLRNIESQISLEQKLEELVLQNQITQAGALIGKMVQGLSDTNVRVEGMVTAVRVIDGKAVLELDTGRTLSVTQVESIAELPPSSAELSPSS